MCVIIVKKRGIDVPTQNILSQAFKANSHGCGFAVAKKSGLYLYKTLNFKKFCKNFYSNVKKDDDCIIHFRLATHGSICRENCHPFANETNDLIFAHNGVLPIESVENKTDSQILFETILAPAAKLYGVKSRTFAQIADSVRSTSKFAFLDANGVTTFGSFESVNGLLFSNLRGLYDLRFGINSYNSTAYRTDDFYNRIFAEHNEAYKTPKYCFEY